MNDLPEHLFLPLPDLYEQVVAALPPDQPAYLVGGAIRDALLGRDVHDLDFVLPQGVFAAARRVAGQLKASFYPLDDQRETARLVLVQPDGRRRMIDFAVFRGSDLESDLRGRDFTLNAIAIDVRSPDTLIDPLNGEPALRKKLLTACSPNALHDDPVRILRAVRLSAHFGFQIEPQTRSLLKAAVDELNTVSIERLRDELVKILEGPRPAAALRALELLGVFPFVWPELLAMKGVVQSPPHTMDVWDHTFSVIQRLGEVLSALSQDYNPDTAANLPLGLMVLRLGRFRDHLSRHFSASLVPDRSLRGLLFLAALYHDAGKPETYRVDDDGRIRFFQHDQVGSIMAAERASQLHLSNAEIDRLRAIIRFHLRPLLLSNSDQLPSRRAIYRFFRDAGPAGIDVGLLSLADMLAKEGLTLDSFEWAHHLDVVRMLFEAWFEHPEESVSPPVLLTGHDLIAEFGLEPGPLIGELLESLREAQAAGRVDTREEAFQFLKERL